MSDSEEPVSVGSLSWARSAAPSEIFDHRAAVRQHLRDLAADERWSDVIELARIAEMPMARGSRWGSWEQVLVAAREAARKSGDASSEAWALHQLGTRAMLRDDLATARPVLHDAMARREALGEKEAALVTRNNLNLLPLALSGVMTALTFFVGLVALTLPPVEDLPRVPQPEAVLDITEEVVELTDGGARPPVELVNRGNAPLVGLKIDPAEVFTAESRSRCATIEVGDEPCELAFDADYDFSGSRFVCIRYRDDDRSCLAEESPGDRGILVVVGPDEGA